MATVLALDRDRLHLDLLGFLLKQDRHQLVATSDPRSALATLRSQVIDLVIVDAFPLTADAHRMCEQIRQVAPYVPLVVLSKRWDEDEVVRVLLSSADDYLTKPLSPGYFLARIHALLRRTSVTNRRRRDEILSIGDIELNLLQMHVVVNGTRVPLTPRELWLLHALMDNQNRVLSREQLMQLAWGDRFVGIAKTVDVCVQRVRKKMAPYLSDGGCIQSVRGFGYKFAIAHPATAPAEQTDRLLAARSA